MATSRCCCMTAHPKRVRVRSPATMTVPTETVPFKVGTTPKARHHLSVRGLAARHKACFPHRRNTSGRLGQPSLRDTSAATHEYKLYLASLAAHRISRSNRHFSVCISHTAFQFPSCCATPATRFHNMLNPPLAAVSCIGPHSFTGKPPSAPLAFAVARHTIPSAHSKIASIPRLSSHHLPFTNHRLPIRPYTMDLELIGSRRLIGS